MQLEQIDISNSKLYSGGLVMRPFRESDLNDFYEYTKLQNVGEAACWQNSDYEECRGILNNFIAGHRTFAIEEVESGKVIGSIGFMPLSSAFSQEELGESCFEVSYVISKNAWGKGYSVQALRAVVAYAFRVLKVNALTCGHYANNQSNKAAFQNCSFKFYKDGLFTDRNGNTHKCSYYVLTSAEYEKLYK